MPSDKDLKRRVRARMEKTGESYTAARAHLLKKRVDPKDFAAIAQMSDEAVKKKTGGDWKHWVDLLDGARATSMIHRDIATLLRERHDVSAWWAQSITVAYERIRGLRDTGERRGGGGYDVNKSKTLPVPIAELYAAFGARGRRRWLGDHEPKVRTATKDKSMRLTWGDDTQVDVYFWEKGPAKSQVQLQHRKLANKAQAEEMRTFWTERLAALAKELTS